MNSNPAPWTSLQWYYIEQLARQARESRARRTKPGGPFEGSMSEFRLEREATSTLRDIANKVLAA